MDMKEKLVEILRKTRYEYRRYIAMKDCEKRLAKTDEEFLAVDDSIMGEIPFCADFLIANGVTVQEGKPLEAFLHPIDAYEGLKAKYLVFGAASGKEIKNCFVLRPDKDPAAVEALRAYASATHNETLAEDIYNWVGKGEPVQEWISVKDRWPEENGIYLTCNKKRQYEFHMFQPGKSVWQGIWAGDGVTHWMPLPQPPKGE